MPPTPPELSDLNLRDIAESAGGALSMRRGLVFRSGHLVDMTAEQQEALDALGLRTIVDLRGTEERERLGDGYLPRGAERALLPISSARLGRRFARSLRTGEDGIRPDTLARITASLTRAAAPQMAVLLRLIADPTRRPLLFHCTHGKDRTGFAAALLLTALDAPWETIRADYLSTNETPHQHSLQQGARVVRLARLLRYTPLHAPEPEVVQRLFRVHPENLEAAFARIEAHWGDPIAYLNTLGLSDARREALRDGLIVV